jgi:hypothetical protein
MNLFSLFDSEQVKQQFNSYTAEFKSGFIKHHQNNTIGLHNMDEEDILHLRKATKKHLDQYEKKCLAHGSRCKIMIQFINKNTYTASCIHEYVVNLGSDTWYQELCMDVRSNVITTGTGQSIENFTREDFVKCGSLCFVFSTIPMDSHQPLKKYHEGVHDQIKIWWSDRISTLKRKIIELLTGQLDDQTLAIFMNTSKLEIQFKLLIGELFGRQDSYKEFGHPSIESLLGFRSRSMESPEKDQFYKPTFNHICEYLKEKICIPVRFIITTGQKLMKLRFANLNMVHHKNNLPINVTASEISNMFTELLEPIFEPVQKLTDQLKLELALLFDNRSKYGMENMGPYLKSLYKNHVQKILQIEKDVNSKSIIDYVDPLSNTLDQIPVPHHYWVLIHDRIHAEDFKKSLMHCVPLSIHHVPHQIQTPDYHSKNMIIVSTGKPGDQNQTVKLYIPRKELQHFQDKEENDGAHLYSIDNSKEFTVICPFTCHILDSEGKWNRYIEHFHVTGNISHLELLNN